MARAVLDWHGSGHIVYKPFPATLLAAYQAYTQASLTRLRAAGYTPRFRPVAEGVHQYLHWLNS